MEKERTERKKQKRRESEMENLNNTECLDDAQLHTGKRGEVRMREEPAGVDSVLCKCSCEPETAADQHFPPLRDNRPV